MFSQRITTHKPRAFGSAMTRLANQNLAEAKPPAWVEFVLHSHPSICRRIGIAREFEVEIKPAA
jgi:STE24 endopeptidase